MKGPLVVHPSLLIPHIYTCAFLTILVAKFIFGSELVAFSLTWKVAVVIGALGIGIAHLKRITTRYSLDAIELVEASGILSRRITRVPLNRITNYQVERSFLERILGIGSLLVDTPGGVGYEIKMRELDSSSISQLESQLGFLIGQQKIAEAAENETLRREREIALGRRIVGTSLA